MIRVFWQIPPTPGADGSLYRTYTRADLPEQIALDEERRGRCIVVRVNGQPVQS